MPKQKKRAKSSDNGKKTKEQFIICPFTDEKVYISNVTLQQIKKAARTGECPSQKHKKILLRIPSKQVREDILEQSALAVAQKEEQTLPLYGGRPWTVTCKFTEPKSSLKSPLFRWFRGELELACLPHYLEKIPDPPKQKGRTMMDDEEDRDHDIKATELQERTVSMLSTVAWTDSESKIPTLQTKWLSPLGEKFYSRKAAWEHASKLTEQQVFIDKILRGFGARGQSLKPFKPTKPQSLKAGKQRFLRDGLWIVGQEESWQAERTKELEEEQEELERQQKELEEEERKEKAMQQIGAECESVEGLLGATGVGAAVAETDESQPKRKPLSALQYYIRCKRVELRAQKLKELRAKVLEEAENSNAEPQAGSKVDQLEAATTVAKAKPESPVSKARDAQSECKVDHLEAASSVKPELSASKAVAAAPLTDVVEPPQEQTAPKSTLVARQMVAKVLSTYTALYKTTPKVPEVQSSENVAKQPEAVAGVSTESALKQPELQSVTMDADMESSEKPGIAATAAAASTVAGAAPSGLLGAPAEKPLETALPATTEASTIAPAVPAKEEKVRYTLADADKELRGMWKSLSPEEQELWTEKAKEYEAKTAKDPSSVDKLATKQRYTEPRRLSAQQYYIRTRRETYRDDKLAELKACESGQPVRFTLTEAANELKNVWKTLSAEEKKKWKERAQKGQSSTTHPGVASETGVVTPGGSDTELEVSKEPAHMPISSAAVASDASRIAQSSRDKAAVVVSAKPLVDHKEASSIDHMDSDAIRVSPSPPLEPPVEYHVQATNADENAAETRVVKRKRSSGAPRKITPSFHWRLSSAAIDLCYDAAMDHYHKVMHTVKARALHSELADGFDVLRERGRGRYDMELPIFETPAFSFLTDIEKASWMPIVREILGQDVILIHRGVFLSMPGAEAQVYHQDGPHLTEKYQRPCHAVNVFIPLVDLTTRNGPTEFCLGTHILGHEDYVKERTETALVPAGTPVIFDYRLGHRGLGNSSASCRPIVYCTYAAKANGKEFRDSVNFSRRRYHKIGDLVDMPLSREERAKKRRLSQEAAREEKAASTED